MATYKLYGTFAVLIYWRQMLIAESLEFNVTKRNTCVETSDNSIKLIDLSIAECVDACVRRQACKSVGYRKRFKLCEIHKDDILITKGNEKSCTFIERKDMDTTEVDAGKCHCSHVGHVCDLASGHCELKECGRLDLPNGKIYGNMHFIGSKILVSCEQGYKERNVITHATCNSTGDWDPTPICEMISATATTTTASVTPEPITTTEPPTTTTTSATKTIKEYYCPDAKSYSQFDLHNDGIVIDNLSSITFEAKGRHDAHVLLQYDRNVYYNYVVEIVIGGWFNKQSVIRVNGADMSSYSGNVMDANVYRPFWISWSNNCVEVGTGNNTTSNTIMSWCGLTYTFAGMRIAFCCGSDGYFKFSCNPLRTRAVSPIKHSPSDILPI